MKNLTRKPFRFKTFTVIQENTAMPVCTDSCVFGALVSGNQTNGILDIGTGTGLLTLMLAQKYPEAAITAIEIDEKEAGNAALNFKNSAWNHRINLITGDINQWEDAQQFDLIVCNPPFFESQLRSDDNSYNRARHQGLLTFDNLLNVIKKRINQHGLACCLIPNLHLDSFIQLLSEHEFYLSGSISFHNKINSLSHVHLVKFGLQEIALPERKQFIFKNEDNTYTREFVQLLKPYYLSL